MKIEPPLAARLEFLTRVTDKECRMSTSKTWWYWPAPCAVDMPSYPYWFARHAVVWLKRGAFSIYNALGIDPGISALS